MTTEGRGRGEKGETHVHYLIFSYLLLLLFKYNSSFIYPLEIHLAYLQTSSTLIVILTLYTGRGIIILRGSCAWGYLKVFSISFLPAGIISEWHVESRARFYFYSLCPRIRYLIICVFLSFSRFSSHVPNFLRLYFSTRVSHRLFFFVFFFVFVSFYFFFPFLVNIYSLSFSFYFFAAEWSSRDVLGDART